MIENVIRHIGGVGMFGIISICLFFAFFCGLLLWAVLLNKPYLNSMRELPLDSEAASNPNLLPKITMNDQNDPLLMDHEADGIRELDNKLPRWWVWLFYITIAFAPVYLVYYHVLYPGNLMAGEYTAEMKIGEAVKFATMSRFEQTLATLEPAKDPLVLETGKATFLKLCAPCHRADAGGLVGPNLTDDYWIHGSNFVDNVKTIWDGVPQKGMITWKGTIKPGEVTAVASYIFTLRGTKPPNPKLPENIAPVKTGPSDLE